MPTESELIVRTFLDAFAARDRQALRAVLHDDIVFVSPRVRVEGAEAVADAMLEFAALVESVDVKAVTLDGDRALVTYDMVTGPFGVIRAADALDLRDGRIVRDLLVFDTSVLGG